MAVIQKTIQLEGTKGSQEAMALFDSGATYSCIRPELAAALEIVLRLPRPMDFSTAKDGEVVTARERVSLNFYLDGYRFSDEFMVIEGLADAVIIGAKTLQSWRMRLDFEHDRVLYDPRVTKLRILGAPEQVLEELSHEAPGELQERTPVDGAGSREQAATGGRSRRL